MDDSTQILIVVILGLLFLCVVGYILYADHVIAEQDSKEKCDRLDMEVFDRSTEGTTCWNPKTKRTRRIT